MTAQIHATHDDIALPGRGGPVSPDAGRRPQVGSEIRWAGRTWRIERINHYPGHGPLLAISALDDESFELICGAGCDGPFEVLPE